MNNDEFYIGYLNKAPEGIHRFTKKIVIGLIAGALAVAALLVVGQQEFYPSTFEFQQYQTFTGTFHTFPYPMLRVLETDEAGGVPSYAHYYLVNFGKMGTQELANTYDGKRVELEGALIYRDDQVMIELKPETIKVATSGQAHPESEGVSLGTFTLTGEIVDSKCFLGVMNPGSQKPHRACATRCISGGIPPLFVVKDQNQNTTYLLLQSEDGAAVNQEVLDVVAEPLEITGEVLQIEDVMILKADPTTYRRLAH